MEEGLVLHSVAGANVMRLGAYIPVDIETPLRSPKLSLGPEGVGRPSLLP